MKPGARCASCRRRSARHAVRRWRSICKARSARRWRHEQRARESASARRSRAKVRPAMFYTRTVDVQGAHVIEQAAVTGLRPGRGKDLPYTDAPFPLDPATEAWADDSVCKLRKAAGHPESRRGLGSEVLAGGILRRGRARACGRADMAVVVNHGPGEESLAASGSRVQRRSWPCR